MYPAYSLTLLSLGERGAIFSGCKFKFILFLNGSWYELENLSLFKTFNRDYFSEKKNQKNIKFSGRNIFLLPGVLSENRRLDM